MMTFGNGRDIVKRFEEAEALLNGHFLYTSGRHGSQFLQAARVLQYPQNVELFGTRIYQMWDDIPTPDIVVGPATGGILLANAVARWFPECRSMYTEKDGKGGQILQRGFKVYHDDKVLVVEDITTTGGSAKKAADYLKSIGAQILGISVLIDRSAGEAEKTMDYPFRPLSRLDMESWLPEDCPFCKNGIPLINPDQIVSR